MIDAVATMSEKPLVRRCFSNTSGQVPNSRPLCATRYISVVMDPRRAQSSFITQPSTSISFARQSNSTVVLDRSLVAAYAEQTARPLIDRYYGAA